MKQITKKQYFKILDYLLNDVNDKVPFKDIGFSAASKLYLSKKYNIQFTDIAVFQKKIFNDGFFEEVNGNYSITAEGVYMIAKGGYRRKRRSERIRVFANVANLSVLFVAAIVGTVLSILSIHQIRNSKSEPDKPLLEKQIPILKESIPK